MISVGTVASRRCAGFLSLSGVAPVFTHNLFLLQGVGADRHLVFRFELKGKAGNQKTRPSPQKSEDSMR